MADPKKGRKGKPPRKAPPNTEWRWSNRTGWTLQGRVRIAGRLRRWALRTGDVELAATRVAEGIARLKAATFEDGNRIRYADAAAAWAEKHIIHEVSAKTAQRYAVSLIQLKPFLIDLFLDEIDTDLCKEIVDKRRAQGVTTATIKRDMTALASVLDYADVETNPARLRTKKLKERRDPIVLPQPASIVRMVRRAPGRLSDLIRAFRLTGCRLEELAFAERTKLDYTRRQLTVIGKRNKQRTIDLDFTVEGETTAYEILRALPVRIGCKWLFWHGDGEPYRNLSSRFAALVHGEFLAAYDAFHGTTEKTRPPLKVLLAAEGGPDWADIGFQTFSIHHLRHLHAVEWLKDGRSIYDLKGRLGHESIKTTEIYLQFLTEEEKRQVMFGRSAGGPASEAARG
ncbi:MAG: site-specific integrase [Alphaproteobacteria bacterium]|nr:MAG: site-specific integrase [Alphaproteobacteria bacterium]